jgi:hypothetical protein
MRDMYLFSQEARNAVERKTNLRILRVAGSLDLRMTMNPPF